MVMPGGHRRGISMKLGLLFHDHNREKGPVTIPNGHDDGPERRPTRVLIFPLPRDCTVHFLPQFRPNNQTKVLVPSCCDPNDTQANKFPCRVRMQYQSLNEALYILVPAAADRDRGVEELADSNPSCDFLND